MKPSFVIRDLASSPRNRIGNLHDRIESSNDIPDDDRELLLEFSDHLDFLAPTYSDHRHEKLLRRCTILGESLDDGLLVAALEYRAAAEEIVT